MAAVGLPAPYKYKKRRKPPRPKISGRVQVEKEDEKLTGEVQGFESSDIEERYARALYKQSRVERFSFRDHFFGPARNTPGAIEVDFMVDSGGQWWPDHIDGEIGHKTAAQKGKDRFNDAVLNAYFMKVGIQPSRRIPDGIRFPVGVLDTQEGADEVVEELYG